MRGPSPGGCGSRSRDTYLDDITAADLASAAGRSRFAVHRAFTSAYGMAPGDYQRQLRLRAARRLIAQGSPISTAAAQAGFSDQSHLTRWFIRCYGVTPGGYQRAALQAGAPGHAGWRQRPGRTGRQGPPRPAG